MKYRYKKQSFTLIPTGVSLLVGGNNAGKSTLIQALSVWEFCRTILLHEKGGILLLRKASEMAKDLE